MRLLLLVTNLILFGNTVCNAQWWGGNRNYDDGEAFQKKYGSFEVGVSKSFPNLTMTSEYEVIELGYGYPANSEDYKIALKKQTVKLTAYGGLGAVGGYTFKLSKLDVKSTVSLGVNIMVDVFNVKSDSSIYLGASSTTSQFNISFAGLPLSIDYKTGSDAIRDKSYRSMCTFGIGVMPYMTTIAGARELEADNVGIVPFAKAEVGIFAGIAFKFRATYTLEGIKYSNTNTPIGDSRFPEVPLNTHTIITSKPQLTLSLLFMPLSWGWKSSNGW